MAYIEEKVTICSRCKGEGKLQESMCTSHHNGDYDYRDLLCETCKGYKYVVTTTTTTIVEVTKPLITKKTPIDRKWR